MYSIHYICTKQRFHFITDQGRRLQSRVAVWRKRSRVFSSTRVEPSEEAKNFIRNLSSMFPLSPKKLQDITWPITQTRFHQNSCSFVDEKGLGRFSRLISPNNRSQDYHFAIACNSYSLKVLEQRQVFFARLGQYVRSLEDNTDDVVITLFQWWAKTGVESLVHHLCFKIIENKMQLSNFQGKKS